MNIDFKKDLNEEEISYLKTLSKVEIDRYIDECEYAITLCDTNQQNRKIAINGLYGASI